MGKFHQFLLFACDMIMGGEGGGEGIIVLRFLFGRFITHQTQPSSELLHIKHSHLLYMFVTLQWWGIMQHLRCFYYLKHLDRIRPEQTV